MCGSRIALGAGEMPPARRSGHKYSLGTRFSCLSLARAREGITEQERVVRAITLSRTCGQLCQ